MHAPHRPPVTRGRDIHEAHRVATPLELLFDLFFVVAIALAAQQLHHGVVEGHAAHAFASFAVAFFSIWWAWMNYTWFASAYDNDDPVFRLLSMVQMAGVLLFSTGVPGIFQGDLGTAVAGFALMRVGLIAQWLRAAKGHPARRQTCLRYAWGLALMQALWVARLWAPPSWAWPVVGVLIALELAVPVWAESQGTTPWHAHHIAERYSLLTIIVLGECVLGATNAVAGALQAQGWSVDIALLALGSTMLVLSLWWLYFLLPSAQALHAHRERAFPWGYGHYFVFAGIAAMGAGLEVVADVLKAPVPHAAAGAAALVAAAADGAALGLGSAPALAALHHVVTPLQAIGLVAGAEAVFMVAIWAVFLHAVRPPRAQLGMMALCLLCIAAVVLAVWQGLPLAWAVPLLSTAPLLAVWNYEHQKRLHRASGAAPLVAGH